MIAKNVEPNRYTRYERRNISLVGAFTMSDGFVAECCRCLNSWMPEHWLSVDALVAKSQFHEQKKPLCLFWGIARMPGNIFLDIFEHFWWTFILDVIFKWRTSNLEFLCPQIVVLRYLLQVGIQNIAIWPKFLCRVVTYVGCFKGWHSPPQKPLQNSLCDIPSLSVALGIQDSALSGPQIGHPKTQLNERYLGIWLWINFNVLETAVSGSCWIN